MRQRPDRAKIKMEWIEETIKDPLYTEVQSDGRIRKWKKIEEENKSLRVILLVDGETVHNAFSIGTLRKKIDESEVFSRDGYSIG